MRRGAILGLLAIVLTIGACNGSDDPTERTPDETRALLVGTWEYDMLHENGDATPMVRVFEASGKGHQYDRETGLASKKGFEWTLSQDGKSLVLAFNPISKMNYVVDSLEPGRLTMTAVARGAFPEECTRR